MDQLEIHDFIMECKEKYACFLGVVRLHLKKAVLSLIFKCVLILLSESFSYFLIFLII